MHARLPLLLFSSAVLVGLLSVTANAGDCLEQKVTASDAGPDDAFGNSVSVSGDVALVGAWLDDDGATSSGSAYVFRHDGRSWVEEAKLVASDAALFDNFGFSVSVSGDVALVGNSSELAGAAYVFRHDGAAWVEEAKLLPSDAPRDNHFGNSVSVSGGVALVGAWADDDGGFSSGAAYLFRHDGLAWVEEAKIVAGDAGPLDFFGRSVSVSGDVALLGAYQHDDGFADAGAAYLFRYDGSAWVEEVKLVASAAAPEDLFGYSVSVSGDVALVGTPGHDDGAPNSGAAYLFRYDGFAWVEEAKLVSSDPRPDDALGVGVSVSGDVALAGNPGDDGGGMNSGAAHLFRHDGMAWIEEAKLVASDAAPDDLFGVSVSVSGDMALAGVERDDDFGSESGAAYFFNCAPCATDLDCDDGSECTDDSCDPASGDCRHVPSPPGTSCDDGDACTENDACDGAEGCAGTPVDCEDGDPCTDDACDPATGECSNLARDCDDGNPCTDDSCDPASGDCRHVPDPPGTSCDDGDACTENDVCDGGEGCAGRLVDCDDGDPCTDDACDPATGGCSNIARDCDDGNPCTDDSCHPVAGCVNTPTPLGTPCDDGDACTESDVCDGAESCAGAPVDCDDGIDCTGDSCDGMTGECSNTAVVCEDCLEQEIAAVDVGTGDTFGRGVSVSGGVALVGASADDDGGRDSGSAYVFRYDGSAWIEEAKLVAGDAAPADAFGLSVSVSGDVALVGAHWDDVGGARSGSAYVFRHDGHAWLEEAKLVASDAAFGDSFGLSVSVSGDVALVGANGDDDGGSNSGSAYVFRYDGSAWVEEAKLVASDAAPSDRFGFGVSTWSGVAVVGAYGDGGAGSAYVFRYDGSAWVEEARLVASDAAAGDQFGYSVSISGNVALMGAYQDDDGALSAGSAYVFRHDGSAWIEEAKLVASDPAPEDQFGYSVSVSGDVALVGAYQDDDGGMSSGSAYLFRYDGSAWVEANKFVASDAAPEDRFGLTVSVSGDVSLVGADLVDDGGLDSGSAYFFREDQTAVPEISPPGLDEDEGAFLVRKEGVDLRLSWQSRAFSVGIYVGALDALRGPTGYDHGASGACGLSGTGLRFTEPLPAAAYLLVVGSDCEGLGLTGFFGRDSRGTARPTAEALGLPTCP